jgi:hypothetical protein
MRRIIIGGALLIAVLSVSLLRPQAGFAPPAVVPPPPGVHFFGGAQWVPWAFGSCVLDLFAAAAVANWRDNRQLTYQEAYTCGLLFWFEHPTLHRRHP